MKLHKIIFIKQEPVFALKLKISSEVNIRIEATVFSRSANVVLSLKTLQKKKKLSLTIYNYLKSYVDCIKFYEF